MKQQQNKQTQKTHHSALSTYIFLGVPQGPGYPLYLLFRKISLLIKTRHLSQKDAASIPNAKKDMTFTPEIFKFE